MTTEARMLAAITAADNAWLAAQAAQFPQPRVCDNTLAAVLADESKRAQRSMRPARNRMVSRPARVRSAKRDFLSELLAASATLSDTFTDYSL